jgi:hypothetical protein
MIMLVPETSEKKLRWWAATVVERFEPEGEGSMDAKRCRLFTRIVYVEAADRESAYLVALDRGLEGDECAFTWFEENTGRKGRWVFEGVSGLTPVADKPEFRGPFPAIRRAGTAG